MNKKPNQKHTIIESKEKLRNKITGKHTTSAPSPLRLSLDLGITMKDASKDLRVEEEQ